ncbi:MULTISPECIES: VCBS domain-containing protein [unclassified Afipia]|uniref:VCBS domain-containing protein n=1 Tax=unclassified Afipia TaxID=2642050 RepID=UPI000462F076|nr:MULTISPECIES: VCBS domain-containing protein [unclassified Afipia]
MSDNQVVVPDAHLLFSGDYMRIGSDLIISGNGQKFVIGNYFKGEVRPVLTTKDGATLSGHIVDALTGHVHYAQATAPAQAGEVIGHVLKMSGSASVIRNGVSVELNIGDPVQKGDVVQTGSNSSVGMTFIDGSAFGMSANARMVLNEMIFDPNGSSNSSLISLVQGTITFVAGQTAKNGNMRVETPVATMGIRGTAVLVEIGANDGPTKFSVLVEPDGHTGSYNLYDKTTGQLIGTVSQAGQVTYVSVSGVGQPPTAIEQLKTLADQESAKTLIQEVFKLYFPNYNPDNANPKSQKNGFGSPGDNLNPFAFYKPLQDLGPPKVITIPGVGYDPVTGQPNPPRTFYNTKAQFSALPVFADQAFSPTIKIFSFKDVVKIDDPDIGNAPFYDIGIPFVAGSAIITSAVSTIPYLTEGFLKPLIHINQTTGAVSFDREQFNFLDDGQTVTFKIQVTATSGPDTGVVEIPITITGANDAPTIVVGAATIVTGAVKEDVAVTTSGHIETNGTITFKDVDLTDAHTATVELTSTSSTLPGFVSGAGNAPTTTKIGTFTIDPVSESTTDTNNQGSVGWHFSLDDNDPTLQSLAEGQTITQIYTITIKDDNGVPVTQTVTITITGTNDAPVLTADAAIHQADEVPDTTGAPNSVVDIATGTLAFADVDLSDTHTASAALHPGASSVVWSGGDYNDIPQATRDALNGAVTASVSESNTDTNNQGSVGWEFKLPDHLFDFLAKGQTLTLIYDVTVTDNNGLSSTKQITVQIGAANDQPVISVIDNGAAVKEDVDPVGGILKDHGSVTFTDADLTDTHTAHVTYNNDAAGSAGVSPALALALATALTVPSSALAAGDHDFNWDFALDTNLIQYLAEGETITATYTITVKDNSNNSNDTSVAKTVTVTITGTNDLPTISITNPATDTEGNTGTPDVAVVTVADHVSVSDVDASDVKTPYAGGLTFDAVNSSGPAPAGGSLSDLFTIDPVTGKISYDRAAFDYLAGGEHVTAVFTFNVSSGPDTIQKSITVTIDGANDAPVIAVTDPAHDTEGNTGTPDLAVVTVADHVSVSDVDASDVKTPYAGALSFDAANSNGPAPAGGSLADLFTVNPVTGEISYDKAAFDYLAGGEHVTAVFTFNVSSGPDTIQKAITLTIDGANDAPVIAVTDPAHDTEGNTGTSDLAVVTVADHVSVSDVDASDVKAPYAGALTFDAVNSSGPAPAGGSLSDLFTIDPVTGKISYDKAAFDYLAGGEHVTAVFTFNVSSGPDTVQKSITVTIDGANDAPVIAVTDPAADTEGNTGTPDVAVVTVADHVSITDVDASDVHIRYVADTLAFDAANSNGPAPAGGSLADLFTVDPVTGKISYDRAAFDYLAAGEHVTATFTFDASSGPDTVQKSITVTIDGENDAPTVAAPLTITTQEGNAPVVRDLLAGASDVDNSDALSVTNIRYSIDGGLETATTPHGIIFPDAHTINIDAAAIQHIPAGVIETIEVRYDIMDGHGGTVAQTETITITGVNDRPVLAAGTNFSTITEDQTTNSGQLVSSFATGISDPDDGALKGVAITGYSNQNGHWEYSIDGGSSWTQFGTYSSGSGLLLASDDKVRFVPNGENGGTDTLTYVAWDQSSGSHGQAVNTMVPGHTAPFSEDSQTASLTVTSINDAPVLNGDNVSTLELGGGVTKVTGIALSDVDAGADTFTVTATADHGTVATATGSQPLAGAGVSGSFAAISNIFNDGAVYTPDNASPTDKVTLTVTDGQGGSDTLNFVFKQYAPGGVTLTGTTGKDIIFSSTGDDTMTGLAGKDNFVFAQVSGHDTIMDFTSGTDKIDFRALSGMDANALTTLLANADHTGGDTLLHINGTTDTLLLKGVAALNASDFILHA